MRKKRAKKQMAVCVRWSQYQGRAALQTSVTDLMDEVSHTHLQYEKRPSPSNTHGPSTMSRFHTTMFFCFFLVISFFFFSFFFLGVRALRSAPAHRHLLSMCAPVFSLDPLSTGHRSRAPAFLKNRNES